MIEKFNVFARTTFIGVLLYDTEKMEFSFELKNFSDLGYEVVRYLNADKNPKRFKDTLFERVCPPNRVNIDEILRDAGMDRYDAWELLKRMNLSNGGDNIWMEKGMNGEDYFTHCIVGVAERMDEEGNKN